MTGKTTDKDVYQLFVNGEDKGYFDTPEAAWVAIPENAEYEIRQLPIDTSGAFEKWIRWIRYERDQESC